MVLVDDELVELRVVEPLEPETPLLEMIDMGNWKLPPLVTVTFCCCCCDVANDVPEEKMEFAVKFPPASELTGLKRRDAIFPPLPAGMDTNLDICTGVDVVLMVDDPTPAFESPGKPEELANKLESTGAEPVARFNKILCGNDVVLLLLLLKFDADALVP